MLNYDTEQVDVEGFELRSIRSARLVMLPQPCIINRRDGVSACLPCVGGESPSAKVCMGARRRGGSGVAADRDSHGHI